MIQRKTVSAGQLILSVAVGVSVLALGSHAMAKSSSTTTSTSILWTYANIAAPVGSIAMTAVGNATRTGTGGTTAAQNLNNAIRYMYFNGAVKSRECSNAIPGGILVPNGSPVTSSTSTSHTVSQKFYCYSGAYLGWLGSFNAAQSTANVGVTVSSQVCLTQAAPAGGAIVKLVSAFGRVSVPASVTIPAGSQCANISIKAVKGSGTEQIFAILQGYALYIVMDIY